MITENGYKLLGQIAAKLARLDELELARVAGLVDGMVYANERHAKGGT